MGASAAVPATVITAGLDLVRALGLSGRVRPASEHAPGESGAERRLPVLPELRAPLPGGGLRRGSTVAIGTRFDRAGRPAWHAGATSLMLALLSAASSAGSWCAVVGLPALGAGAAAETGVVLDRLALVPHPGLEWATVVAALLDGVDLVVAAVPGPVPAPVSRRLMARARQRGSVLIPYGQWDGADVTFEAVRGVWQGLGEGRGRLRCRQLTVTTRGRGTAAAPRRADIWLPRLSGPLPMITVPTEGRARTTGKAPAKGTAPVAGLVPVLGPVPGAVAGLVPDVEAGVAVGQVPGAGLAPVVGHPTLSLVEPDETGRSGRSRLCPTGSTEHA